VEVLLEVHARCIDGRDNAWFDGLDRVLDGNGS
jgi:hypothetical protein